MANGTGQFDFSGHGTGPARSTDLGGAPGGTENGTGFGFAPQASFGTGSAAPLAGQVPSSPVLWLLGGIALAVIAAVAAILFADSPFITIPAWFAAGPVAISLFAVFTLRDTALRTNALYSVDSWVPWLYRIGLVVVLAAIVVCALAIALWVGRL